MGIKIEAFSCGVAVQATVRTGATSTIHSELSAARVRICFCPGVFPFVNCQAILPGSGLWLLHRRWKGGSPSSSCCNMTYHSRGKGVRTTLHLAVVTTTATTTTTTTTTGTRTTAEAPVTPSPVRPAGCRLAPEAQRVHCNTPDLGVSENMGP